MLLGYWCGKTDILYCPIYFEVSADGRKTVFNTGPGEENNMNPKRARSLKITILCFVAVTAIFFGWAAVNFLQELIFLRGAEQVTGTVTDIAMSTSFQDQQTWTDFCPVVTFQTRAGRSVEYNSEVCQSEPAYQVGQKVVMLYDPRDPKSSQMQNWQDQYDSTLGPIILGAFIGFIGLIILLASIQKDREIRADKARWGN